MFTIIIPVYNKEKMLEESVSGLLGYLKKNIKERWRIIIAERGSTDNTHSVALNIAKNEKRIRVMGAKKRLGLGLVLKRSIAEAEGDVITFEPGAIKDFSKVKTILEGLRDSITGPDMINGSRFLKGSRYHAPFSRIILSKIYNVLVNFVFKTKLSDYQCEFKAYKPNVFKHLCFAAKSNHKFWFTESLVKAQKMDYIIKEIPVHYEKKWIIHPKNFFIRIKNIVDLKLEMGADT